MNARCPCGTELTRRQTKYCSRYCSGAYGGGKRPLPEYCRTCGWRMDAANVYTDALGNKPRCRRCTLAKGRTNYVPAPKGVRRSGWETGARTSVPAVRSIALPDPPAPPPVVPARPVWRPAGFSAQPVIPPRIAEESARRVAERRERRQEELDRLAERLGRPDEQAS